MTSGTLNKARMATGLRKELPSSFFCLLANMVGMPSPEAGAWVNAPRIPGIRVWAARSVMPLPVPEPPNKATYRFKGEGWRLSNGSMTTLGGMATDRRASTASSNAQGFTRMPCERA